MDTFYFRYKNNVDVMSQGRIVPVPKRQDNLSQLLRVAADISFPSTIKLWQFFEQRLLPFLLLKTLDC
jgi:hypothetical protein